MAHDGEACVSKRSEKERAIDNLDLEVRYYSSIEALADDHETMTVLAQFNRGPFFLERSAVRGGWYVSWKKDN